MGAFLLFLAMAGVAVSLSVVSNLRGREGDFLVWGFYRIFLVGGARTPGDPDENYGASQQNENNDIAGCEHDMSLSRGLNKTMQIDDRQMTVRQGYEFLAFRMQRYLVGAPV
jgi:hypothetical protein